MTIMSYSDSGVSPRTNLYAAQEMLDWAHPVMVLDKFAETKPMPKNKTETIKFRRPIPFTAKTVPLVEGVTPPSTAFAYEDVSVSLKQYGDWVEITDKMEDLLEDPVLNDASQQCGENIGRTMEALTYGVVRAGTNVYYTNGTSRTDVNTPVSVMKLRAVVRGLEAQKAKKITKMLSPSMDYGTKAIEAAYIAFCHTDLKSDIRNLPGFVPVAEYGSRQPVHDQEFGTVEDIRFLTSPDLGAFTDAGAAKSGSGTTMVSTTGTSADVYPIIVIGEKAYATVPLKGMGSVTPGIMRPGKISPTDPLGQRGFVSWKTYFAALILNQAWIARLETAATAL